MDSGVSAADRFRFQTRLGDLFETSRRALYDVEQLARQAIPDFHFLTHKVSNFWHCEKSPIGWCVWKLEDEAGNGLKDHQWRCWYCGGGVSRK
jgi:hypothetical protein